MTQKRSYKQYPKEFKEEAVALVTEQGYTVPKAAEALGVAANMLYRWKDNAEKQKAGITLSEDERTELKSLRQDADQGVRAMSVDRLSIPGAEELLPELEKCLASEIKMYVRVKIVETIGKIGGYKAKRILGAIATKDRMARVRSTAYTAWKALKGTNEGPAQKIQKPDDPMISDPQVDDF